MKLAVRTGVTLLLVYLLIVLGLFAWVREHLRHLAGAAMEDTANLVGREVAVALSESAVGELLSADSATRMRMLRILHGMTQHSEVVRSIAVVDANGRVLASDDFLEVGRNSSAPETFFPGSERQPVLLPSAALEPREWRLVVPLAEGPRLAGYLRIALASARLETLYAEERRQLVVGALVAAALVGALGFLLHVQLARQGEDVARALEQALHGEVPPPPRQRDEFAAALEAAGRVGQELQLARERGSQERHRLMAVSEALDLGVLLLAPGQELDFANARACQLLGAADREGLAGRWPQIGALLGPSLHGAPGAAGMRQVDIEVAGTTGWRWLRCQAYPLAEGLETYLVLLRDRAMIEALETDLVLASQLRGLTRVYQAVTHDLRAPLHSMVLNLELLHQSLLSQESGDDREQQLEWLAVLKEEVGRLNRSLQALLADAAPPPNQPREVFDAREVVQELERLLLPQARLQGVELRTATPEREVPLLGYRDRVKQAILNIAINALEAMPQGGTLGLRLATDGRAAELVIEDTGPGIPGDARARIFDLHFTTKTSGTGIGLYVARSVTEAHGGQIAVDSQPGLGSRFRVNLPVASAEN